MLFKKTTSRKQALNPDEAKAKVFEHWHHLDALAKRRFRQDENLAHQAIIYAIDKLAANRWERVRTWQGLGDFLPFLLTLGARLFTDFSRERFGHIRKPLWLQEKNDPLWDRAYHLLIVDKYSRREVLEFLRLIIPPREATFLEDVVLQIQRKCRSTPQTLGQKMSTDDCPDPIDPHSPPDEALQLKEHEIVEILQNLIAQKSGDKVAAAGPIGQLITRLSQTLQLSDEDRLLLRLRYQEGIKMKAIVTVVSLKGDPYKRINKLIKKIRKACSQEGILDDIEVSTSDLND